MNTRHEHYCHVIQHILDVLHANRGVADTAAALKISTGQLSVSRPRSDLWAHANRIRRDFGHPL